MTVDELFAEIREILSQEHESTEEKRLLKELLTSHSGLLQPDNHQAIFQYLYSHRFGYTPQEILGYAEWLRIRMRWARGTGRTARMVERVVELVCKEHKRVCVVAYDAQEAARLRALIRMGVSEREDFLQRVMPTWQTHVDSWLDQTMSRVEVVSSKGRSIDAIRADVVIRDHRLVEEQHLRTTRAIDAHLCRLNERREEIETGYSEEEVYTASATTGAFAREGDLGRAEEYNWERIHRLEMEEEYREHAHRRTQKWVDERKNNS